MAERQIVEHTGRGIVCFISNSSWLDGLSHTAMRERFLEAFDHIRIDNLHGDKFRTGKLTPQGEPDPSAFSTAQNREGIKPGTAISTLVRRASLGQAGLVEQRDWYGRSKLEDLASAAGALDQLVYGSVTPQMALGRTLLGKAASADYLLWPTLPELFPVSYPGVKTSRDAALVDIDRSALVARMTRYFDGAVDDAALAQEAPELVSDASRFDAKKARSELIAIGMATGHVVRYAYRPFDVRWLFWHEDTKLLDEKRPDYFPQAFAGNYSLVSQQKPRREWSQPQCIAALGCLDLMDRGASCFPMLLDSSAADSLGLASHSAPNLHADATKYATSIGADARDPFFHALAVMHSAAYCAANESALRQDWPRIPLPAQLDVLRASAQLGREIALLLDTETPVPGVTSGTPRPELKTIASVARLDGAPLAVADFALTAGWGSAGQGGVTMPGKGRVENRAASAEEAAGGFGTATHDVYLNAQACWRHVPPAVWNYTLGGYQVLKKWLSYREQTLLGRALTLDEVKTFTAIARRIAALLSLRDRLDANYQAVSSNTVAFKSKS